MSNYYVICITKKPRHDDPYTKIQSYGVSTDPLATTAAERWSEEKMIDIIEENIHTVKAWGVNPKPIRKSLRCCRSSRNPMVRSTSSRKMMGTSLTISLSNASAMNAMPSNRGFPRP